LPKTEARIAQFQKQNAEVITANKHSALLESMGQQERDDLERRAREERMEMVANAERLDRVEEERAKTQIGEALVCLHHIHSGAY
jgi:CDK-activating kinase assembly factor MAT1